MIRRRLGRSEITVSALGLGCWAIGGQFRDDVYLGGGEGGWGAVDDRESVRALQRAFELGVNFVDTADNYGCGHSERLVGRAIKGRRDQIVVATKFGHVFDESRRVVVGIDASPDYVRAACDASLRRLGTDYIDLYQFHLGEYDVKAARGVRETLEELVRLGKIRYYGWSTDDPARAAVFAEGEHCAAIQHRMNVFYLDGAMLELCGVHDLASINRSPLGSGFLTGKFNVDTQFEASDGRAEWDMSSPEMRRRLEQVAAIRDVLTANTRTVAQGALSWLWAQSERTIPIPGFKTTTQVEENARALIHGPLSPSEVAEIQRLLEQVEVD